MVSAPAAPDGRRLRRHEETREQIMAHAVDIMGTEGVVGLTLGELARRLGVRTPSLYTYFDSKNAVYDELFRRGWQAVLDALVAHLDLLGPVTPATDIAERVLAVHETFIRWALDHPAQTQLMMFRPVPAWEPTPDAYAPSVAVLRLTVDEVASLARLGLLRPDADLDEFATNLANIGAGVIARQLGNEPGVPYELGSASRHFPALCRTLVQSYLPEERP